MHVPVSEMRNAIVGLFTLLLFVSTANADLSLTIDRISDIEANLTLSGILPVSFPPGYDGERRFFLLGTPVDGTPSAIPVVHAILPSNSIAIGTESLEDVETQNEGFNLKFTNVTGLAINDTASGSAVIELDGQSWALPGSSGELRWGFEPTSGDPELVVGQWSVTTTIPEPSSMLLFGSILSGVLFQRSRKF